MGALENVAFGGGTVGIATSQPLLKRYIFVFPRLIGVVVGHSSCSTLPFLISFVSFLNGVVRRCPFLCSTSACMGAAGETSGGVCGSLNCVVMWLSLSFCVEGVNSAASDESNGRGRRVRELITVLLNQEERERGKERCRNECGGSFAPLRTGNSAINSLQLIISNATISVTFGKRDGKLASRCLLHTGFFVYFQVNRLALMGSWGPSLPYVTKKEKKENVTEMADKSACLDQPLSTFLSFCLLFFTYGFFFVTVIGESGKKRCDPRSLLGTR